MQERDKNNNVVNEYTWGLGLPGGIGGLLHLNQGGAAYSYLYDSKGNVTALLDGNANVAATYQYDPFGAPRGPSNSINQPMQFSTKPYDEKTGLSHYGYRFYVPSLGRWLTRDPIGEAGGINLYGFVNSDPINKIDPFGLRGRNYPNLNPPGITPTPDSDSVDYPFVPYPRPFPDQPSFHCPTRPCKPVFHPDVYWSCVYNSVLNEHLVPYAMSFGAMLAPSGFSQGVGFASAMAMSNYIGYECRKKATFCD